MTANGRVRGALAGAVFASAAGAWTPAMAWGDHGHRVIAYIANAFLTPAARAQADLLLRLDVSPLTARDMAARATWADRFQKSHQQTAPWHYIGIDYDHPDPRAACRGGDCLPAKISDFERVLADPRTPAPTRAEALVWLLNLVGDAHQPLHTINRRDNGGECEVIDTDHGRETLHAWWDDDVVDALGGGNPSRLGPELARRVTRSEVTDWSRGTAWDWVAQSYTIAKAEVYAYSSSPHCRLPADALSTTYIVTAKEIAAKQLQRAGVRLAAVLNAALIPAATVPAPSTRP